MSSEQPTARQRSGAAKHRRSQQKILDTARRLFDERGYHAVTMEEISRESGISVVTVYGHFSTKQSVVIAAYAPQILELMRSADSSLVDDDQTDRVIAEFILRFARVLRAYPALAYGLLSLAREQRAVRSTEGDRLVLGISLGSLAELLGELLAQYKHPSQYAIPAAEVADFYLSGMLVWIVQYPERSVEEAAAFILSQLL